MIIDETVEINIKGKMFNYYNNLGYDTKKKMKINISDLPYGSTIKIKCQCDNCGLIKKITYRSYLESIKLFGYYSCMNCCHEKIRLYSYNKEFFKNINEESAYWLGFIIADGCITKNKLSINLSEKDKEHLEKFKKSISSNHPIKIYKCQGGYSNMNKNRCSIQIIDNEIVNDLLNIGVLRKKSLINIFPDLIDDMKNHFMRGYFDGDGSVYIINIKNKKFKTVGVNICGTNEFLIEYAKLLNLPSNLIYKEKRNNTNTWNLKISGIKRCKSIFEFLYNKSTIELDRKKEKWLEIFKIKNEVI